MMQKKTAAYCLVLACLAGLTVAVLQSRDSPTVDGPDLQEMLHTPKTATQMQLYSANRDPATGKSVSGKSLGFEYYKDNGKYKHHVHNVFEDGSSEHIYLRKDETREMLLEYFAPVGDEELELLRSRASFGADGKTFTSHDVYSEKGKLQRQGRLLDSGNYQQTYFCKDSGAVERLRLFNEKKEFLSEKLYSCTSGKLTAEVFPGGYSSQVKVKLYRADGTLQADLTRDWQGVGGDVFAADGKTVVTKFKSEYSSQTVWHFSAPEQLSQMWASSFGRTKVTTYNSAGRRMLLQEWKERPGENGAPAKLLLVKVTEFGGAGGDDDWTRKIEMTDDGQHPALVTVPVPAELELKTLTVPVLPGGLEQLEGMRSQLRIAKSLDKDGLVTKTELTIDYQSWNNTVQAPAQTSEQIRIAPELLALPARQEEMPRFDNLGPDRVYDYDAKNEPNTWPSSYQQPMYGGYGWHGGP